MEKSQGFTIWHLKNFVREIIQLAPSSETWWMVASTFSTSSNSSTFLYSVHKACWKISNPMKASLLLRASHSLPQTLIDLWGNIVHHIFSRDLSIIHNPHLEMDFLEGNGGKFFFSFCWQCIEQWEEAKVALNELPTELLNGNKCNTNTFHFIATIQRWIKLKLIIFFV